MTGRILYRGVATGDSHPLADSGRPRPLSTSGDELLDPRIQVELETLNKAAEDINRLELQLNEARSKFRQVLTESTQMLNIQAKKLGSCIEKARPYYDARIKAKEAQTAIQIAALRYERACGQLNAAKEMVYLAEEGFFNKGQPFDPAWQEMLNHATIKVNDAEKERYEGELEHQVTAHLFAKAEQHVKKLQKDLRRNITKSKPYFEMKSRVNQQMEDQKMYVSRLESQVISVKRHYASTLSNLERISDEIHHQRKRPNTKTELGQRGVGVGAESPLPKTTDSRTAPVQQLTEESQSSQVADPGLVNAGPSLPVVGTSLSNAGPSPPVASTSLSNAGPSPPVAGASLPVTNIEVGPILSKPVKKENKKESTEIVHTPSEIIQRNLIVQTSPFGESSADSAYSPNIKFYNNQRVVLRKPRLVANGSELRLVSHKKFHHICSPSEQHTGDHVPSVKVTAPSFSAPTSPIKPDSVQDLEDTNVRDNAEVMASIQRLKSKPLALRSSRRSEDDLLDTMSDTESLSSMASASMLDDEQISSLMLDMGDYTRFLSQMDEKQTKNWKRLSLPAKLTEVEKTFNLDEFLAEARIIEEDSLYREKLAPTAQEEDDSSFELIDEEEEGEEEEAVAECMLTPATAALIEDPLDVSSKQTIDQSTHL